MISEYGFYVSRNSYYGAGRGNADVRWSNFILEPIVHVKDDQNARRLFRMRNDKGEEAVIKLDQRSLVSFADFRIRTESKGNYIWEAGQGELTKLKNTCSTGLPRPTKSNSSDGRNGTKYTHGETVQWTRGTLSKQMISAW